MLKTRVIPTLLLRNSGLVKGEKFSNHKYVGDPINAVKIFNTKEVDELVFFDIGASIENRKPNYALLADIASEAFMPFGYGGGLNSIDDIENIFKIGVEKAIINTAATRDMDIIRKASDIAGSQSIVVAIDVRRSLMGKYQVYSQSGRHNTGMNPVDYAKMVADAGAGELIVTAIDREGTGRGYDTDLIAKISQAVSIPVVVSGGAGKLEDFRQAVAAGASAVAAGNLFVFHGKHKAVLITYPDYQSLEELFDEH